MDQKFPEIVENYLAEMGHSYSYPVSPYSMVSLLRPLLKFAKTPAAATRTEIACRFWTIFFRKTLGVLHTVPPHDANLYGCAAISRLQGVFLLFAHSIEPPRLSGEYIRFRVIRNRMLNYNPYSRLGSTLGRSCSDDGTDSDIYEVHVSKLLQTLTLCMQLLPPPDGSLR